MPVDSIDQPEVLMCLSPIWTEKHETAKRLSQRIKTVLDVAKSKPLRTTRVNSFDMVSTASLSAGMVSNGCLSVRDPNFRPVERHETRLGAVRPNPA
nr:hypothetical protein [Ruegeria lacuscaerulensis]